MNRIYNLGRQTGAVAHTLYTDEEIVTADVFISGTNPIIVLPSGSMVTLDGYTLDPSMSKVSVRRERGRYIIVGR